MLETEARAHDLDRAVLGLDGLQYGAVLIRSSFAVSGIESTRPAGTSALAKRSAQVAEVSFFIAASMISCSALLLSMRFGQSAKRGSASAASQPSTFISRWNCGSVMTASTIQPSLVLNRLPVGLRVTERFGGLLVHAAGHQVLGELLGEVAHHRVDHGDVDQLALAGMGALVERRGDAERGRDARHHVGAGEAHARRAVRRESR